MKIWHLLSGKRKPKKQSVEQRRLKLSRNLAESFDFTVRYGPFAGLRLIDHATWGPADRAAMLLGVYEQEVLNSLTQLPTSCRTFIELGSADGYYVVGALSSRRFDKGICYEQNEASREVTRKCAELNNVSDKLSIRGEARKGFWKEISAADLEQSVVLVDIEGREYDLFDAEAFQQMKHCVIIIELHEEADDADEKVKRLVDSAALTHKVQRFPMSSRDLSSFPELKRLSDTDRWLMCSEGRPYLMSWIRLDPIKQLTSD